MSKRSINTTEDEIFTSKRQKVNRVDPPFPSDSSSSSSSSSSDGDEEEEEVRIEENEQEEDSSMYHSSSSSQTSIYDDEEDEEDEDDEDLSSIASQERELGEEDLLVVKTTTTTRENFIEKPKWFSATQDIMSIARISSKKGQSKEANKRHKAREDYSVKIHTIKTGKSITKVKQPYGSVNQELYDQSFILKSKVCNYEGLLQHVIIENEETHDMFMIDYQLFDYWVDDECEKRFIECNETTV